MDVLIIGKSGQVAWELMQTCPDHITAMALGRNDIDITSAKSIENAIVEYNPTAIINASAYTAVDKAESDTENAYLINATAVELLAKSAHTHGIRLLHISTDFVFDGNQNRAYQVDDQTNPINVYGASKLAGEEAIKKYHTHNSTVVRTSWVYSSHGNNFVKTMLRLMSEKEELNIVSDQIGCPTNAKGLAKYLWTLAEHNNLSAVYHYSDLGIASWYDFAVAIQELSFELGLLEKKISINPIPSSAYPTPAKRPSFGLLKVEKSEQHWQLGLRETLKLINLNKN
ncbi:dTDP-4-dehydrorhamnose reductase [Pseudoalteromonas piscicida]|uniref:dTDP-4-dehydrorhamnose reductase n=1 Tax=Pseudoalteromonas piscicida TaxID=43662 RepID=A0AAD0REX6_PSEO7|nr:dTDP-4-dehydrorhamnose reductase [Pseudoalteromonas piscicida]ASD68104.1 dTDP-4-dehydrorhamnose reductase [Pseudoalteromonas piscicida]AXR01187.1 dTDP-4-dehydrorhamnose reductase [Pseudoalteromonas piscicida]